MTCKYCGKENSFDAKFCQGCGKELTNQENSLQKENGYLAMKEAVSGKEYDVKSGRQGKKFMRICAVLIICVVGGFILNKFGIFRFLPVEISDCLGMEMDDFQNKYFMSRYDEDSLSDGNVLVRAGDDGKIISVYSDCKGVFRVYGIVCGMSKERVMEKMPDYYSYHSSKDGLAYYISYDTDRILAFNFDESEILKKYSYFYYDATPSGGTGTIEEQSNSNKDTLSQLPEDVSILLGENIHVAQNKYQLKEGTVFDLENDNVYISDTDSDGRIDMVNIVASGGNHTLLGMKCNDYFNHDMIPSGYEFYDSADVSAMMKMDGYTRCQYLSQDKHKILVIEYWKDERIKSIMLLSAEGQIDLEESSSDENQEDDLVYGLYGEDNDYYDYGEDDNDYDDYDYDYEDEDDSYSELYNLEYSQAITQRAINARWDNPDSYILPNSNKKKLSEKKLSKLNLRTVQFAIDELCARHGRRFDDKVNSADYGDMKDYFESKNWYQVISKKYKPQKFDTKIRNQVFNEVETYNFFLLAKIRDRKKNN